MESLPIPIAAFIAGLISFLSPCVLPLVPGYVSLVSGTGAGAVGVENPEKRRLMSVVMVNSLMFIAGFTVVFVILGAGATALGTFMARHRSLMMQIAGVVIIIFGLHLTGIFKIKYLYADKRMHAVKGSSTPWGSFVVGFAFAFGWTPCTGPILATILTFAMSEHTVAKGMLLLGIYALGLAVPFLLTSLAVERFMVFYTRFRRHLHTLEVVSGGLLIVIGVLILTRNLTILAGYLSFLNRFSL